MARKEVRLTRAARRRARHRKGAGPSHRIKRRRHRWAVTRPAERSPFRAAVFEILRDDLCGETEKTPRPVTARARRDGPTDGRWLL